MLSEEARERIRAAVLRYADSRGALLPALQIAQNEHGYLSEEIMKAVAAELDIPEPEVYGTATFYSLFRERPAGRHVIAVCQNLTCTLLGAEPLIDHLRRKFGVDEGQVTSDGRFLYERIECIGRCDGAPAMLVDEDYYTDLTPEKIDAVLEQYR